MLIPLDYYRILGVPIQATEEQIAQAYHDREWQKPRREYSEMAIAARKDILTKAYKVLSSPLRRTEYDTKFLPAKPDDNSTVDSAQVAQNPQSIVSNPTIEVPSEKFVGALLLLQELGEYELVLRSGIAYLNSADFTALKEKEGNRTQLTIKEDITLTLALAYLELGREQWQKGEYENAALSGEMGYNLLVEDNLYSGVQSEIKADLNKLRPYRILELMAHGEHKPEQKSKAFQLLNAMLSERKGIEGQGEDHSGLNFEQFLCFIQQLRQYLTATEQQELFAAEAKRPSAVATYLTVYALLGQGFAHKKPHLIVKAQQMLQNLSKREDVAWEQSICALLLGKTQEANLTLQKTKEEKILNLIQQHSQDSPDLLPGLCLYGEKWLQQEVLSQFRDLASCELTLTEYFADRNVQTYLEQLYPTHKLQPAGSDRQAASVKQAAKQEKSKLRRFFNRSKKQSAKQTVTTATVAQYPLIESKELVGAGVSHRNGSTATLPRIDANGASLSSRPPGVPANRQENKLKSNPALPENMPTRDNSAHPRSPDRKGKHKQSIPDRVRYALFFLGMILGIGFLGFGFTQMMLRSSPQTAKQSVDLGVEPTKPTTEVEPPSIPDQTSQPVKPKPKGMTETLAKQTIERWLESKSAAFGSEHKIDSLESILASSLLSTWRERALHYQKTKEYRQYKHEVTVTSVTVDAQKPNEAVIEAQVKEKAQHYQGGKLNPAKSYDDKLLVRYHLIRQNEQWFIDKSAVVKTL